MINKIPMILKEYRQKSNKLQKEVAEAIGVSERTYCNYENGKRQPDIETLIKTADYYNISLDVLTGRYEPTTKMPKFSISRTRTGAVKVVKVDGITRAGRRTTKDTIKSEIKGSKLK